MKRSFLALLALPFCAVADLKIDPVPGQSELAVEWDGATDLSAITWVGENRFFVVSNREKNLIPLRLKVDAENGRISDAEFGGKIKVETEESDFEGLIYMPEKKRFFVSTETRSAIVGFDLEGDASFRVDVPRIFREARKNKSLESLAWNDVRGEMWTANEDALDCDGSVSGRNEGGLVRLQRFDARLKASGQFAYRTEPSLIRVGNQGTGVTDMVLLPEGDLLVLERVLTAGFGIRIFRVDYSEATDVSEIKSLEDAGDVKLVKKHLLYERLTGVNNYEGMTIGPALSGGGNSLILIADNGGGNVHHFMPLRLKREAAEAPVDK